MIIFFARMHRYSGGIEASRGWREQSGARFLLVAGSMAPPSALSAQPLRLWVQANRRLAGSATGQDIVARGRTWCEFRRPGAPAEVKRGRPGAETEAG